MPVLSKNELIDNLYEIGAIKIEEIVLRSGGRSPIYIDFPKLIRYPALIKSMSSTMWLMIKDIEFDQISGVPLTATFATTISHQHDIPLVLIPLAEESQETEKLIGRHKCGDKVMVCSDVITSGSSIMETVKSFRSIGMVVENVCVFVDREQKGIENLSNNGIQVRSFMKISDILNRLVEKEIMKEDERIKITNWLKENPCELSIE